MCHTSSLTEIGCSSAEFAKSISIFIIVYGTVSAKIAPRLKCYKNASRLNRYNFQTDNAIDFLFSTLHSEMVWYEVLKIRSRQRYPLGSYMYSDSNAMHFYNILTVGQFSRKLSHIHYKNVTLCLQFAKA